MRYNKFIVLHAGGKIEHWKIPVVFSLETVRNTLPHSEFVLVPNKRRVYKAYLVLKNGDLRHLDFIPKTESDFIVLLRSVNYDQTA